MVDNSRARLTSLDIEEDTPVYQNVLGSEVDRIIREYHRSESDLVNVPLNYEEMSDRSQSLRGPSYRPPPAPFSPTPVTSPHSRRYLVRMRPNGQSNTSLDGRTLQQNQGNQRRNGVSPSRVPLTTPSKQRKGIHLLFVILLAILVIIIEATILIIINSWALNSGTHVSRNCSSSLRENDFHPTGPWSPADEYVILKLEHYYQLINYANRLYRLKDTSCRRNFPSKPEGRVEILVKQGKRIQIGFGAPGSRPTVPEPIMDISTTATTETTDTVGK
nr:MAG: hypothetical protein [Wenzhou rodent jeilongvirus 2]